MTWCAPGGESLVLAGHGEAGQCQTWRIEHPRRHLWHRRRRIESRRCRIDIKSRISGIADAGFDIRDEKFDIEYGGCDAPDGACDPKGVIYIGANDSRDVGLAAAAN
jgi:hypothetical protein